MAFRDGYHSFAYSMRANFHQRIAVAVLVGAVLLGGWHARQWWLITQSIDASAEVNLIIDAARNGENPDDWSAAERSRKFEAIKAEVTAYVAPKRNGHARDVLFAIFLGTVCWLIIRYNLGQARKALAKVGEGDQSAD